ncbi:MAG: hypothetical protein EBZ47_00105 [Chlamydiae bacterium]|nr:hypothetical protein [Chlamydiota bacterium]
MISGPSTLILRHKRENLKKCSLRGLEARADICFFTYPKDLLPDLSNYILLGIDAPLLTREDADKGLFLIDGTWRYASVMQLNIVTPPSLMVRSLPSDWITAYPRRQNDCPDPKRGLASVEALYAAFAILGKNTEGLLDNYYWKEDFLKKNKSILP